jgi:Glycosyl transferase family 2
VEIAVVILAQNRQEHVDMVLSRLSEQDVAPGAFRVVVVDNGSPVPLAPVVERYTAKLPVACIRIDNAISRPGARNLGLAKVTEPNVLFTDGDVLPDRDLIRRHLDVLADEQVAVSLGSRREPRLRTLCTPANQINRDPVSFAGLHGTAQQDMRIPNIDLPVIRANFDRIAFLCFYGSNLALRTSVAVAAGGFNEDLVGWGLDDLEFGFRVRGALRDGQVQRWSPQAGTAHIPRLRDFGRNLAEMKSNQETLLTMYQSFHWEGHKFASSTLECLRLIMLERIAETVAPAAMAADSDMTDIERWVDPTSETNSWLLGTGVMSGWETVPSGSRSSLRDWRDKSVPSFCGTQLPAADSSVHNVVNVDVWRVLPWHHVSEMLAEAARVARTAYFVSTARHDRQVGTLEAGDGVDFAADAEWLATAIRDLGFECETKRTPSAHAIRVRTERR